MSSAFHEKYWLFPHFAWTFAELDSQHSIEISSRAHLAAKLQSRKLVWPEMSGWKTRRKKAGSMEKIKKLVASWGSQQFENYKRFKNMFLKGGLQSGIITKIYVIFLILSTYVFFLRCD